MEFVFIGYISHLFCNRVLWNLIFLMYGAQNETYIED